MSQIITEFGGSAPYKLSNYYRGGGLVPNTAANVNVPTSGPIKLSDFYGASASSRILNATGVSGTDGSSVGYSLLIGSMSPTVTSDGRNIQGLANNIGSGVGFLQVAGFGSDPGKTGWAGSINVFGVWYYMASADSYFYSGGTATWGWNSGFPLFDTVPFFLEIWT